MTCKIKINHPLYFYILFQLLEAEVADFCNFSSRLVSQILDIHHYAVIKAGCT